MEMTRRTFVATLAAAGTGLLTGAAWVARRLAPQRILSAARGRFFPGKIRPLKENEVIEPGKWAG